MYNISVYDNADAYMTDCFGGVDLHYENDHKDDAIGMIESLLEQGKHLVIWKTEK